MFSVPEIMDGYGQRNMAMPFADVTSAKYKAVYMPFQSTGLYQPAIGKPMYFQPDHTLDGGKAIIRGIELIDSTQEVRMDVNGQQRDNLTPTQLRQGLLYICNIQREIIATIPLYDLLKTQNSGKLLLTDFREHVWQGCYVEFTDIAGVSGGTHGLKFIVYYDPI